MKIEQQLNMKDRTLLLGKPDYNIIPNNVSVDENTFKVIGISCGVKLPYISIEIEKTDLELIGKIATANSNLN